MFGSSQAALELPGATGTLRFSTIVDSGGTNGYAIDCSGNSIIVQSSIVWTPGVTPYNTCITSSSIAGPTTVTGAMNVDPMFVNAAAHDYHLKPSSPAQDFVTSGPALDFERDPRPQGAKFDIGADEVRQ
jgi:hypothetical protein